ncbi:cysteine peptidase family C39 domain-containing protein [Roseomonas sp. 18066]|uniref:cysteine peptidase family C39 domain-containing protein n=1 Tax=Roseomonas sp. 18066 TaxID=2681412 RepID=UPI00135BE3F3|nr:cysteine peptidase family C39 domain-containing protein [Roseomonas sp. 18066]
MKRAPLILQQEAAECGAACLAMVLAAHRCFVPLDELRIRCGVSRNGSRASALLAAAAALGLEGRGLKREVAQLGALPLPAILFWNFNHFVVLEALLPGGGARLLDPAQGRVTVDADALDRAFTGICLSFTPGPEFRRRGAPASARRLLLGPTAGLGRQLPLLALLAGLAALPLALTPALGQVFIDEVLLRGQERWLAPLLLALAGMTLFRALATLLQRRALVAAEAWMASAGEARFLARLLDLPLAFFAQRHTGELTDRLGVFPRLAAHLAGPGAEALSAVLLVPMLLALAVLIDPLAGAAMALLALLMLGAGLLAARRLVEPATRLRRAEGLLAGATLEGFFLADSLRAAGRAGDGFARWSGHQAQAATERGKLARGRALWNLAPATAGGLLLVAVLAIGGWQVMAGRASLGQVVALQMLAATLLRPLGEILRAAGALAALLPDAARVDEVFRQERPVEPPLPPGPAAGRLEFRAVRFGHSPVEPPILDDVSFVLEPGQRLAVVGGSGSGKSTLGRLAAGLHAPWSGEVLLDGVPVHRLPAAARARLLAHVDQSVLLFAGTVRENLAMFRPEGIGDAEALAALRDAALLEELEARPGLLEAPVAEFGRNFSGGQRQRLELARALAGDPALLVLDEATAALDPPAEARIERCLRRRGIATLAIAHRLSTVRDADEILVLEKGRVVERGRHAALLAAGGAYAGLLGAR